MKYVNLVEICLVVFKIQEVAVGEILVRVNNTRVLRTTFLAARHTTVCLNNEFCLLSLSNFLPFYNLGVWFWGAYKNYLSA